MSALHDWHRTVFTKRTPTTLVFPAYSTTLGGNFPEVRSEVTLASARSVIAARIVHSLTPAEWAVAQAAFDASDVGVALKTKDAGDRREHAELWLLHQLHESDHPDMVAPTELALQKVLDHHAKTDKLHAHKARLMTALAPAAAAPVAPAVPAAAPTVPDAAKVTS